MVEAIISIFIVGFIFTSFLMILPKIMSIQSSGRNLVIASSLAQEGIEMVRNIRDNNWKEEEAAFVGFKSSCDDYCNWGSGKNYSFAKIPDGADELIDRGFERKIKIDSVGNNKEVIVTVTWKERNETKKVEIVNILYAWADY